MYSILFGLDPDQTDELIADLWESGTSGIIEEAGFVRGFYDDENVPDQPISKYQVIEMRRETENDYTRVSREGWDPILVGAKFFIAPSWVRTSTPAGRIRLTLDDSAAFGTGRHESTQLMLRALEEYLCPEMTVLDVGAGSGILSLAARQFGATRVFSCDIHIEAVARAFRDFQIPSFAGSADAVRGEFADLLLVNISARIIDLIAADLRRIVKPNGLILLAGFLREEPPSCSQPEKIWEQDDWQCWLCRPETIDALPTELNDRLRPHSQQWW